MTMLTYSQEAMLGALIGLMNAIPGNEEMIAPSTDEITLRCLHLLHLAADEATVVDATLALRREKFRIVPGCAVCQHPCGRTMDFDMALLHSENEITRSVKLEIIERLSRIDSLPEDPESIRAAIRAISEYWKREQLLDILAHIS